MEEHPPTCFFKGLNWTQVAVVVALELSAKAVRSSVKEKPPLSFFHCYEYKTLQQLLQSFTPFALSKKRKKKNEPHVGNIKDGCC